MTALVYDQEKEIQEKNKEIEALRKKVAEMQSEKTSNESNQQGHAKAAEVFDFKKLKQPESSKSNKSRPKETVRNLQKRQKDITSRVPQLTGMVQKIKRQSPSINF